MKIFKKLNPIIVLIVFLILLNACNSYIEEEIYSDITTENFITDENADQLIVGLYTSIREVYKNYSYKFAGTDIFTTQNEIFSFSSENDYNSFNAPQTNGLWSSNYSIIARANTAINLYENSIDWSTNLLVEKTYGIAQAKALRALAFFNLVQQYGGIVLDLEETQTIRNDYTRSSEQETFSLIISELEAAIPNLKDSPEFGRLSKRAAQHILSEVYLTRAYKSFGESTDYASAAALAESAIGSYDIRSQTYEQLFDYDNQENAEILFSAQWGNTGIATDNQNNKHSLFMTGVQELPGVSRATPYGKSDSNLMPTPYFYSLFETNDTRDAVTFHRVIYADEESSLDTDDIAIGDTLVYFPKQALDATKLLEKLNNYWVYQPNQYLFGRPDEVGDVVYKYERNPLFTNFPIFKKFDDEIFQEETGGARDTYIFRVAESHLLAAEAYLGAGDNAKALSHLNIVRERATGVANYYTAINLDVILVERALELAGEENRWAVLKRMGKLEECINLYNPHVVDHGAFSASKHLLRPIPIKELEISPETMLQNPEY